MVNLVNLGNSPRLTTAGLELGLSDLSQTCT